jgi:NhaP-type Na+/H+ or K+/H+ antiporter
MTVRRFRNYFARRAAGGSLPAWRVGILVSWCGMRGLVTLATAFALPPEFPQREVIVLSAFVVVLGTLVIQGFTIRPLITRLRIAKDNSLDEEIARTRSAMLEAGLEAIRAESGPIAEEVRAELAAARTGSIDRARPATDYDLLRRRTLAAERKLLNDWRREGLILDDAYHYLEDELDRSELGVLADSASWLED